MNDQIIQEIRDYLNEISTTSTPDKLGGGRTNLWLKILLEEIDNHKSIGPKVQDMLDAIGDKEK